MMSSNLLATPPLSPRLLDLVSERIRVKHYSPRTKKAYVKWIKRHILVHDKPLRWGAGRMAVEVLPGALTVGSRPRLRRFRRTVALESVLVE